MNITCLSIAPFTFAFMRQACFLWMLMVPLSGMAGMEPGDTARFYRKLHEFSKDHKLLYLGYRAIFNVPRHPGQEPIDIRDKKRPAYDTLAGRVIRNIVIQTLEPFGTSLTDSMHKANSFVEKAGNFLHARTRKSKVRDYLLFTTGEQLNPFALLESERLLRGSEFIRDAVIRAEPVGAGGDSVDIYVTTQDLWTFNPILTLTSTRVKFGFTEYNFAGYGHRFHNRYDYHYKDPDINPAIFEGSYRVPNINNTYINAGVDYRLSKYDNRYGLYAERPFFSPLTRNAGGVEWTGHDLADSISFDDVYEKYDYRSSESGAWFGRSFRLLKGNTIEEQSTRMVVSAGYTRIRYTELEPQTENLLSEFVPVDQYLAAVGITNRKYYRDNYIFRFGEPEDVPSGRTLQVTAGYEYRDHTGRMYAGVTLGGAGYVGSSGYFSAALGMGSYFYSGETTQGVVQTELFAFSRLFKAGRWNIRWFGYSDIMAGINREADEELYFSNTNGIPGYDSDEPTGTTRFTLNMRVLFFNPIDIIGFRFVPLVFGGIGMMGDEETPLYRAKVYKAFGAGIAITNVFLANSNFELLFGFYPDLSGFDPQINPIDVWNFKFSDFRFGKPEVLRYE